MGAHDLRVADVRWYLDPTRRGREAYGAGHIPGAVFLDMDEDLSAPGGGPRPPFGRHPWPGAEQVARVMSAAGIGPGVRVVAYDDQAGAMAARLWYLLRAYGHDAVAVLDGGLQKWTAEGRPLESAPVTPPAAVFVARPREGWVLDKAAMVREGPRSLVLDARSAERYRGDSDPIDPRGGHIRGRATRRIGTTSPARRFRVSRPRLALRATRLSARIARSHRLLRLGRDRVSRPAGARAGRFARPSVRGVME